MGLELANKQKEGHFSCIDRNFEYEKVCPHKSPSINQAFFIKEASAEAGASERPIMPGLPLLPSTDVSAPALGTTFHPHTWLGSPPSLSADN